MFCNYGGQTFEIEQFLQFDQTAQHDETMTDYLWTKVEIRLRMFWHPAATYNTAVAVNGALPGANDRQAVTSMDALRKYLNTPRRQLLITVPDGGDGSQRTLLRSPLARPIAPAVLAVPVVGAVAAAARTSYVCDAKNGPIPEVVSIDEVIGEEAFVVDWKVTTWINECVGSSGSPATPLISNRWRMSHVIDKEFHTTRIIEGTAWFRTDLLYDANARGEAVLRFRPDQMRAWIFPQCPYNTKRRFVSVDASPDGSKLDYRIEDQEVDSVVNNVALIIDPATRVGADISDIKGTYTEHLENVSDALKAVLVGGGLIGAGFNLANVIYPTTTWSLNVRITGTRRATRLSLIRAALRTAAAYELSFAPLPAAGDRIPLPGGGDVANPFDVLRRMQQRMFVSSRFTVDIVDRKVELTMTYTKNGAQAIAGLALGIIANAGARAAAMFAGDGVLDAVANVGRALVAIADVVVDVVNVPVNLINFFRAGVDALGVGNPRGILDHNDLNRPLLWNVPDQIRSVTLADAEAQVRVVRADRDLNQHIEANRFGPVGDLGAFRREADGYINTNSRGTVLATLVHQVLSLPCATPPPGPFAPREYNQPLNRVVFAPQQFLDPDRGVFPIPEFVVEGGARPPNAPRRNVAGDIGPIDPNPNNAAIAPPDGV